FNQMIPADDVRLFEPEKELSIGDVKQYLEQYFEPVEVEAVFEDFNHNSQVTEVEFMNLLNAITPIEKEDEDMNKAMLIVSFGTSHQDAREKTIEMVVKDAKNTFKNFHVKTAFTSSIIRNILKKRGESVKSVQEALSDLSKEGYEEVLIQPLHVICGEEFHQILADAQTWKTTFQKLEVGTPLLTSVADYHDVVKAFENEFNATDQDTAVVFMGHGTEHPANSSYACLQSIVEKNGYHHVFVGTVEGYPEFEDVLATIESAGYQKVKLIPLMLVAGDHAKNDMAGDEPDSWKSILEEKGYTVECVLKGMGENPAIRNIYIEHIWELVNEAK
ncbi:MAG: sirohydrochlorin cobaltochelatase, partial [Thermotogota bacterium]|nr:sirohydrochlorin cobaltochelatase [Thermotogota bacterium]